MNNKVQKTAKLTINNKFWQDVDFYDFKDEIRIIVTLPISLNIDEELNYRNKTYHQFVFEYNRQLDDFVYIYSLKEII